MNDIELARRVREYAEELFLEREQTEASWRWCLRRAWLAYRPGRRLTDEELISAPQPEVCRMWRRDTAAGTTPSSALGEYVTDDEDDDG